MARLLHESVFLGVLLIPSITDICSLLKNLFKVLSSILFFYVLLIRHPCVRKKQYSNLLKGWRWLDWSLIQIKNWRFSISKLISQKHPSLTRPFKRSRKFTQNLKSSLRLDSINSRNFPLGDGLENYQNTAPAPSISDLQYTFIQNPLIDISSTQIRKCLQKGESVAQWIPDVILSYLEKNNLLRQKDTSWAFPFQHTKRN